MKESSPNPTNLAQSRVVQLLRSLSSAEVRKLKSFAQGDYFCKDPQVRSLLHTLAGQHPGFPEKSLDKQKVFSRVFKGQKFSTTRMNDLLSDTTTLIERFMAVVSLENDPVQAGHYIVQRCSATSDEGLFEAETHKLEKIFAQTPESLEKLYQIARFRRLQWAHWNTVRHQPKPEGLSLLLAADENYRQTAKQFFDCESRLRANLFVRGSSNETPINALESPLPPLMSQVCELLTAPQFDEASFLHCSSDYRACFGRLSLETQEDIFGLLLHCCNRHKAQFPMLGPRFCELTLWILDQPKAFTNTWWLLDGNFLNVAVLLGQGGEMDAMRAFIVSKAAQLPETVRETAELMAFAYFYYFTKKFDEAYDCVMVVKKRQPKYHIRVHSLSLRLLYEQGVKGNDFNLLRNALDAFAQYFERKEAVFSQNLRESYMGLHKFIKKLVDIREKKRAFDPAQLMAEFHGQQPTPTASEWIKIQIEALRR